MMNNEISPYVGKYFSIEYVRKNILQQTDEEIQTRRPFMHEIALLEKHMIISALEFFVDYRFNTGKWMNKEYINKINQIDHNDFAKLCKTMGGKTRFEPNK